MESMNKIAFFCGCILLVLLVCPTVTANDQFDQYFNEGLNYLNLGQYSEALTSFDKVNAIDSYYPNVWNDRGLALYGLGRYSEALTSYDKALTLNQSHANAWYNRGVALYRLGRYSEAVASFDKANAINPNDSDTAYNRKIALENKVKPNKPQLLRFNNKHNLPRSCMRPSAQSF